MNREQQIRAAVKLLDGRGREWVEAAIELIELENIQHKAFKVLQTQKSKRDVGRLLSILSRARVAYDKLSPNDQTLVFGSFDLVLEKYEKRGAQWLNDIADMPAAKPKRDEFEKRVAVREARNLLLRYGYKDSTTRDGRWYQLAAILYGDPSADLYKYLCELKKKEKGPNRLLK